MSYNKSVLPNSNYPCMGQSDWDNAPWSESTPKPVDVEVTISMTLSKTVKISVDDYSKEVDEDGNRYYDFSSCDLYKAVKDQVTLPNEAYSKLHHTIDKAKDYQAHCDVEDLKGWYTDDFEVVLE